MTLGVEKFRFSVGAAAYIGWLGAFTVIGFLGIWGILRHRLDRETTVVLGASLIFYLILAAMFVMQNATLILSSTGIERTVLGMGVRRCAWSEIRCIKQFALYSRASGRRVIVTKLYRKGSIWKQTFLATIAFPSRPPNFSLLIRALNSYASRYHIRILQKRAGRWIDSTELSDQLQGFE